MEIAFIIVLILGTGIGYKVGYAKGKKVNAPVGISSGGGDSGIGNIHK